MEKYNGTICGIKNNQVIYQPFDSSLPNGNVFVASGPGGSKTQGYVIPNVLMNTEMSQVVTDPKGEVYEWTAKIKEKQGFQVLVLNFDDMYCSMRYNPLAYVETQRDAITVAELIVASKNDTKNKDIWYNSQVSLLTSLILLFKYEKSKEDNTIPKMLEFLQNTDMEQDEETGMAELDNVFHDLPMHHPARKSYDLGFGKSVGKTRSSIAISIMTTLSSFLDNEVGYFMSDNDFIFDEIVMKKSILYIITPAMDESWDSMINLAYSQLFQRLYKVAKANNLKVPVPLNIIADEFPNVGKLEKVERFLATCRGFGITMSPIIQNITQLYDVYGKDKAESIIGNCAIKIHMGNCNKTTNEYFAGICGKATYRVETGGDSESRGGGNHSSASTSHNYTYVQADLITAGDIDAMDEDELLLKTSFHRPIIINKYRAYEMFPEKLMKKYRAHQEEFEAYQTEYAKQFISKQEMIVERKPRRRDE